MSTHSHKVQYSPANVPFSWENKPGVSKEKETQSLKNKDSEFVLPKLPPPPCPSEQFHTSFSPRDTSRVTLHDFQLPLPPCTFQPLSRSSSVKGLKIHEDPFLLAFQECTKPAKLAKKGCKTSSLSQKKYDFGSGLRSLFAGFSCKRSSSVRDDSFVKVSKLPYQRDRAL